MGNFYLVNVLIMSCISDMNIILNLIFILFFAYFLFKNSLSTKGYFKAKVLHMISLAYLFYTHSSSFRWIVWLINQNNNIQIQFNVSIGIIPASLNFYQSIIYLSLSIVIVLLSFGMLNRNDLSRRTLIKVLPFVIPSGAISFYGGFRQHVQLGNDYVILLVGFVFFSAIYFGLLFLYRSKFMVEFFKAKSKFLS